MSCALCPAAFVIAGATPQSAAVLCRVDSTQRGQQDASRGPVALVRKARSPAAFHGFCHGNLQAVVKLDDDLGALATPEQRDVAAAVRASGSRASYMDCSSWRAERANRLAARLAEQPGERRIHSAP